MKPSISSIQFTVPVTLTITNDNLNALARSVLSNFDNELDKQMSPYGNVIPLTTRHEIFKTVYDCIMNEYHL